MQSLTIKTSIKKKEKVLEKYGHFGWTLHNEKVSKNGKNVKLNFSRDKKMKDYATIRKLEKAYRAISKPVPVVGLILIALAGGFLVPVFLLEEYWKDFLIIVVAIFGGIGLFDILAFLFVKTKHKKMSKIIFDEVDELVGNKRTLPTKNNVEPTNKNSGQLYKEVTGKKIK